MNYQGRPVHADDEAQRIVAEMQKGDPRCPIPIGTRVKKIDRGDTSDLHKTGHAGVVFGSKMANNGMPVYLVHFDGDPEHIMSFIIATGIEPI